MTMPGPTGAEPGAVVERVTALIRSLDSHPDRAARDTARELLGLVLDLHGIGLAKLMAILSTAQDKTTLLARLVDDHQVRAMLLLHGLHPDDLETRVGHAVERLRPHIGIHGLHLEVVGIANGVVRLRLQPCTPGPTAPPLLWSLTAEIEAAVIDAAPDVDAISIEGSEVQPAGAMFDAAD